MKNNFKFKSTKDKTIVWSISIGIAIIMLTQLILTAQYSYDYKVTEIFYKSMKNFGVRIWTAATVLEGWASVINFLIPLCFICLESLYAFNKKNNPNGWCSKNMHTIKFYYIAIGIFYFIFLPIYNFLVILNDQGLGFGFNREFLVGKNVTIPVYVFSTVFQFTAVTLISIYIRQKLSKSEKFLENNYWRNALILLLFTGITYLIIIILKDGINRPYFYNINWGDVLKGLRDDPSTHKAWEEYMSQTEHNWGYNFENQLYPDSDFINTSWNNIPADFPWWKSQGWFAGSNPIVKRDLMVKETAMPSGHMCGAMVIAGCSYLFMGHKNQTIKTIRLKWIFYCLGLLYCFNLMFALLASSSHWLSDIAFTVTIAPITYAISKLIIIKISNKLVLKIKKQIK